MCHLSLVLLIEIYEYSNGSGSLGNSTRYNQQYDIRHSLWSKYIMHKVCSEIYVTRWCYNLWCANGPGSLGNVLLAPQPRFRDLALPSIKYWNQFFHIPTHFNRKSIVNESLRLLWFSKPCPCPASFTLCSRCPHSMLPCFLLFIYFFKLPFL